MRISRREHFAKNILATVLLQFIGIILSFGERTIFVKFLGTEYLGINSLYSDVLTSLSLVELGIGSAIVFALYKPLAEKNQEKLKSIMSFYGKAYRVIGLCVLGIGLCLIPFLSYIIGDVPFVKENLTVIYTLFLVKSSISYFLGYKGAIITADQKDYLVQIYQKIFQFLCLIGQCIILFLTHAYALYLIIGILVTIANNIYIYAKVNNLYPFLREKNIQPLNVDERYGILVNVKSLFIFKIGATILDSTDSIFMAKLFGITAVGLYANYKLIVGAFKTIINPAMQSVVASVGNLIASDEGEKCKDIFYELFFMSCWIFGYIASGMFLFLNSVIELWLGNNYLLSSNVVVSICVMFYVWSISYPTTIFRQAGGLFSYGKIIPVITAFLNILLNMILGLSIGLSGIFWATIFSRLLTFDLFYPIYNSKYLFHEKALKYFTLNILYAVIAVVDCLITWKIVFAIPVFGIWGLIIQILIMTIVYNSLFALTFCRTKVLRGSLMTIGGIIKIIVKKHR